MSSAAHEVSITSALSKAEVFRALIKVIEQQNGTAADILTELRDVTITGDSLHGVLDTVSTLIAEEERLQANVKKMTEVVSEFVEEVIVLRDARGGRYAEPTPDMEPVLAAWEEARLVCDILKVVHTRVDCSKPYVMTLTAQVGALLP